MDYAQRVNNLRQKMEANGLDGFSLASRRIFIICPVYGEKVFWY